MLFVLGKFDHKSNGALKYDLKVKSEGDINYLSYKLGLGTVCDLTGNDRSTEVQFYCNPTQELDSVLWIKEVNSCEYKMGISTKKICGSPVFAPPEKISPHKIDCRRILSAAELEELEAKKAETKNNANNGENEKQTENKQQQDLVSNLLYNDLDFSGGEWKQLRLDSIESVGKNIQSYRDDPQHTLSLLMEKLSVMVQKGVIKNAKGESITAKDEFSTVIELVDLNERDVILVKIALTKGDLLIGIVNDKNDDSEDIYEVELEDDDDKLDESNDFEKEEEGERMLFLTAVTPAIPTNVYAGAQDEDEDENFEPFLEDQGENSGQQADSEQDDTLNPDDPKIHEPTAKQAQPHIEDVNQAPLVADEKEKDEKKEEKVYYYYDGDEYLQDKEHFDDEKEYPAADDEIVHDEL
ncbi:hypothetical protein D0Z00_000046 [Geotrichum galactomycetum]|uniref:Uncharacterized protein n=1 Tax=Geotrichum galactomycetum TaxID=27317 RepID=A0ACB6VB39_9ASCO|nr:hypothetical protein D0Z00_000046 [Geotrichum candidum]